MMDSSEYIKKERREYSLYVLSSRAIPHITDGLKSAARRVLWMAKDGKKIKSSALAGSCASIHPHAAPEGAINTIAAPYGNNISLLKGYGAFGTLLKPTSYGASRYTSVAISQFTKDVVFADIELIPMMDNYDGTIKEPRHFLPLIPMVLLNPQEGIAVGFASNILPRSLSNIISDQIRHLKGNTNITQCLPSFSPLHQVSTRMDVDKNGKVKWIFVGSYKKINATTINITNLPYGLSHQKFIDKLEKLEDIGTITNIVDDSSDNYNIVIKFKKGILAKLDNNGIINLVHLEIALSENMNVVDFGGSRVWSTNYISIITDYTDWRLQFYAERYIRLARLLKIDIQRLEDILLAIKKNIGGVARKIKNRGELKEYLNAIGIKEIDYIADLPIYRFTEDERMKAEAKLVEHQTTLETYNSIVSSKTLQKDIYIDELQSIDKKASGKHYVNAN